MFGFLNSHKPRTSAANQSVRRARRSSLAIEALERRDLMSINNLSFSGSALAAAANNTSTAVEVRQTSANVPAGGLGSLVGQDVDDRFEHNDSLAQATNFGTLTTATTVSSLIMADSQDWFRFRMAGAGTSTDYVRIDFQHARGDLDLALYNSAGQLIRRSAGVSNSETISLSGQAAGDYYVQVYGYNGVFNPTYSLNIRPAGDDRFEENDSLGQATNLGTLTAPQTTTGLVMFDSQDWFRFRMNGTGASTDYVRIDFQHAQGDLDLALYNSAGQLVRRANGIANFENISLAGLAGGDYYVQVYGYNGVYNPSYSLAIRPGSGDDRFEENDSLAQATNLGTLTTAQTTTGLAMLDGQDWFRFNMSGTGTSSDFVRIDFQNTRGDLDVALYNSAGQLVRRANGVANSEVISLAGLAAGDYYVQVYGYNGAQNPDYSLTIDPATGGGTSTNRVLYMNFDGATITYADMQRWAGTDWNAQGLDPERDGIRVNSFFGARADREQIIQGILSRVQQDLSPFGITVMRTTSLAAENVGATTLFLGASTVFHPHIACDVDFGNNNRTDIAFVGEENWGSVADTISALSDVALHEAGHTYGLFHVQSTVGGTIYNESMGLRYSNSQSAWLRDTAFLDQTFAEYQNHGGGRGSQNAYRTMLQNFGLANLASATGSAIFNSQLPAAALNCDDHLAHAPEFEHEHEHEQSEFSMMFAAMFAGAVNEEAGQSDADRELQLAVSASNDRQVAGPAAVTGQGTMLVEAVSLSAVATARSEGAAIPADDLEAVDSVFAVWEV